MASCSLGVHRPPATPPLERTASPTPPARLGPAAAAALLRYRGVACSAVPESSTATVAGREDEEEERPAAETKKPRRAPPWKAPQKPLPEMMEEDVIPALRAALEARPDISGVELSFRDNRLEGSFMKEGVPYYFWAFFPNGTLTGPKGFAVSSHGISGVGTVEPFLVDEKKITPRHVAFWVEKRLAAQGILPVWKN